MDHCSIAQHLPAQRPCAPSTLFTLLMPNPNFQVSQQGLGSRSTVTLLELLDLVFGVGAANQQTSADVKIRQMLLEQVDLNTSGCEHPQAVSTRAPSATERDRPQD